MFRFHTFGLCLALAVGRSAIGIAAETNTADLLANVILEAPMLEIPEVDPVSGFTLLGGNWALPLTAPDGPAAGLQLGGGGMFASTPGWSATFGGFSRNLPSFGLQKSAAAVLFDYQPTDLHDGLWSVRPIVGTTITRSDEVGVEGTWWLKEQDRQLAKLARNQVVTFWKRGWSPQLGTEFGIGYEFRRVRGALFRSRAAIRLTRSLDLWCGGDLNVNASYAVAVGLSYHFGTATARANLNNIGPDDADIYSPFPTLQFPSILYRRR